MRMQLLSLSQFYRSRSIDLSISIYLYISCSHLSQGSPSWPSGPGPFLEVIISEASSQTTSFPLLLFFYQAFKAEQHAKISSEDRMWPGHRGRW